MSTVLGSMDCGKANLAPAIRRVTRTVECIVWCSLLLLIEDAGLCQRLFDDRNYLDDGLPPPKEQVGGPYEHRSSSNIQCFTYGSSRFRECFALWNAQYLCTVTKDEASVGATGTAVEVGEGEESEWDEGRGARWGRKGRTGQKMGGCESFDSDKEAQTCRACLGLDPHG